MGHSAAGWATHTCSIERLGNVKAEISLYVLAYTMRVMEMLRPGSLMAAIRT